MERFLNKLIVSSTMRKSKLAEWLSEEPRLDGEVELGKASPNEFMEFERTLSNSLIKLGFNEVVLPEIIDKADLDNQLGINFYINDFPQLAVSSRMHTLTDEDIKKVIPDIGKSTLNKVKTLFDDYSSGKILARDVPRLLVEVAGLLPEQAILLTERVMKTKFSLSGRFLSSSLCSLWFKTLSELYKRYPSPRAYFAIGNVHIFEETRPILSGVLVGDSSISQLKGILSKIFSDLNMTPSFLPSITTYLAFIPRSFMKMKFRETTFGHIAQLSSTSLHNYGIEDPVFYFEIDLLKMYRAMGKEPLSALYPQFYGEWYLSDEEIASKIGIEKKPKTKLGKEIVNAILKNAKLYSSQPAPCEFKVYEREFDEKALEVWIVGYEKSLVGPGFSNELVVYKGSILALPSVGDHEALINGVKTGIKMGDALANFVAAEIENEPLKSREFQFDKTTMENANLHIPSQVLSYIKHIGGDLKIDAPVFFRVEARIRRLWVYKKGT